MHRVTTQHRQGNASAQSIRGLNTSLVRAKGSWEVGKLNFVFCWLRGQEVGLRACLDGHQLLGVGQTGHKFVRSFIKNKVYRNPMQTSKPRGVVSVSGKEEMARSQPNSTGRELKPLLQLQMGVQVWIQFRVCSISTLSGGGSQCKY